MSTTEQEEEETMFTIPLSTVVDLFAIAIVLALALVTWWLLR